MIPWKRTLGWALCAVVATASAGAEEPEAQAMAPDADASTTLPTGAEASSALPAEADVSPALPAEAPAEAPADSEPALAAELPEAPAEAAPPEAAPPALGAVAWDSQGRQGRIHVVVRGDTLWDISNAYLGTPWVWPSIWNDNGEIENPHRIHPGDHIWITPGEMRRLTPEEAEAMLANAPPVPAEAADLPAALASGDPMPEVLGLAPEEARVVRVSSRETAGLISPDVYTSAASVVGRVPERILMSQEDDLYIGLGESEVQVGDEFTVVRSRQKVLDPDTGALLGYHVDLVGWVEVEETFPETSRASIRMSTGEVEEGDRLIPREPLPPEIAVQPTPEGVEGKITFFPGRRVLMGFGDFVYLNRGELDGLEVGSPLEVYRPGYPARERSRDELVEVPDLVVAKMLVVRTESDSAVALVTSADIELTLGDRFRGER